MSANLNFDKGLFVFEITRWDEFLTDADADTDADTDAPEVNRVMKLEPHSQYFIFFVTYKWAH